MSGSETNKRSVQFSDELGEPEDGKSTTWDTHQLVDFLQNQVGFKEHKAKVVAPVLLKNGYDTKQDLLDASRESLASSGILFAHIDKIFIWIESQKEPNGRFYDEEGVFIVVVAILSQVFILRLSTKLDQ